MVEEEGRAAVDGRKDFMSVDHQLILAIVADAFKALIAHTYMDRFTNRE